MTTAFVRRLCAALLTLALLTVAGTAESHELDSASLSLTEVTNGRFRVRFRASSPSLERELGAPARFPSPCRLEGGYLDCGASGLVGSLEFPWLEGTLTRVMVEVEWLGGGRLLRIVTASSPHLTVYGIPASAGPRSLLPVAVDYTKLGIAHIVTGFDHLLFVVALALLVRRGATLVATITAFTLSHSLSLAATVLGLVTLPAPPVEAAIALSIVLVCRECLRPETSLTKSKPWLVAFAFGLLHGLGFASALLEIGLPEAHLPLALFSFNLGVELGQLGILGAVLGLRLLARRVHFESAALYRNVVYTMGGLAAFWCIERLGAVIGR